MKIIKIIVINQNKKSKKSKKVVLSLGNFMNRNVFFFIFF